MRLKKVRLKDIFLVYASKTRLKKYTWAAPASDGGSPITGYTVEYRVSGTGAWSSLSAGTATSANVTGLTNGTSYEFRVIASNAVGVGAASAVVSATAGIGGNLANTGFTSAVPGVLALLLIALGATFISVNRRRPTPH